MGIDARLRRRAAGLCAAAAALALLAADAQAAPPDDYVRGYADAVLANLFDLSDYDLDLADGTLRLTIRGAPQLEPDTLVRALLAIEGVERVDLRDDEGEQIARMDAPPGASDEASPDWELFPVRELFEPLLADPRWPHFSATYQAYLSDSELGHVGATSFGESFALLRSPESPRGRVELGFQAGVFSVFDLEANSSDLVNSDFMVGLTGSWRWNGLTSMLRFYHQSSHLGDEYLLRNRVDRVNLSYEVLDLLLSYDFRQWLRLYGGGGLLVHREPDLDRGLAQMGVELESPDAFFEGYVRPIAAADIQFREESDWNTDLSTRFGIQIEHARMRRLRLQFLGEYYRGRSPNGQFYERRIETLGVGIHLGF